MITPRKVSDKKIESRLTFLGIFFFNFSPGNVASQAQYLLSLSFVIVKVITSFIFGSLWRFSKADLWMKTWLPPPFGAIKPYALSACHLINCPFKRTVWILLHYIFRDKHITNCYVSQFDFSQLRLSHNVK